MRRPFGELEAEIAELVRLYPCCTVAEIQHRLGKGVAYTTVMTVLTRLWKKGAIQREKSGRSYLYSFIERGKSDRHPLLDRLRTRLFGGNTSQMVSYLIESGEPMSDEEAAKIEALLKQFKEGP